MKTLIAIVLATFAVGAMAATPAKHHARHHVAKHHVVKHHAVKHHVVSHHHAHHAAKK